MYFLKSTMCKLYISGSKGGTVGHAFPFESRVEADTFGIALLRGPSTRPRMETVKGTLAKLM